MSPGLVLGLVSAGACCLRGALTLAAKLIDSSSDVGVP
jgi:hypothetical protein